MTRTVSVIIPTYNRADVLRYSVDSVLAQSYPVSEVIIVDDGSTDNTPDMVTAEMKSNPKWRDHVRYLYQENQGQSAANNLGISKATGEWLGFNANDDLWLPWKLEWQFRALEKCSDCGLCFTDAWFMNNPYMKSTVFGLAQKGDRQAIGTVNDAVQLIAAGRHPIWMQTVLARTDVVREVGGVDPAMRYSEDHDFMFRLALKTKFCFVSMPMVLIDRSPAQNRHTGEARNWHREEFCLRMDQYRFEKQLALSAGLSPSTQKLVKQNLSGIHSAWANWYLEQDQYEKAASAIATAASYKLTPGLALKRTLTQVSPRIAKWALTTRKGGVRHDRASWQADESPGVL